MKGNFHDQFLGEGGTATCPLLPDMYGQVTQTVGTLSADFGYAGYYVHAPSGLNLTTYRAYSPTLGRWINRDPIGEDGGVNLYSYVLNKPVLFSDPRGLSGSLTICALPAGTSSFCGCEPGHVWLSWKEDNSFIGPHIYGSPLESTTYGTYEGQGLQPGKDGGLISGSPNQGGYCKTIKVDDAGEFRLKAYIAAMSSKGESAWKFPRGTCVQFANNGWNVAGGPGLGLNGWSGPQDAADAIQAHGGLAF